MAPLPFAADALSIEAVAVVPAALVAVLVLSVFLSPPLQAAMSSVRTPDPVRRSACGAERRATRVMQNLQGRG